MSTQPPTEPPEPRYTPEEYLDIERGVEFRSEFIDGRIVAMSGATEAHNLITGNIFASLHAQLRGRPCRVYSNDLRVRSFHQRKQLYAYPDVVALCGEPRFEDRELDTLLNPSLIVEVLSPSTERFDRGEKFARYRTLESLREYLLVAQHCTRLELFARRGDVWVLSDAVELDAVVALPSIGCTLALRDVYERLELPHPYDLPVEEGEGTEEEGGLEETRGEQGSVKTR